MPVSLSLDQELTEITGNLTVRIPIRADFELMTGEELEDAVSRRQQQRQRAREQAAAPLTEAEKVELIRDLKSNKRVLYWLNQLQQKPKPEPDERIIDALRSLLEHRSQGFRRRAEKLLAEMSSNSESTSANE